MFAGASRDQLRTFYFDSFQKHQNNEALTPLEQMIVDVLLLHPEYLALFNDKNRHLDKEFSEQTGGENPFLHLSGHIGLREQLSTDRPAGILSTYQQLLIKYAGDNHQVEHLMIPVMLDVLFQASQQGQMPDERVYLERLKQLL